MFDVYHRVSMREEPDWDIARNFPRSYRYAGRVFVDSIDDVFRLTNHIDCDWTTQVPHVEAAPGPQRSTSVGDVIIDIKGQRFGVMPFGYAKLVWDETTKSWVLEESLD